MFRLIYILTSGFPYEFYNANGLLIYFTFSFLIVTKYCVRLIYIPTSDCPCNWILYKHVDAPPQFDNISIKTVRIGIPNACVRLLIRNVWKFEERLGLYSIRANGIIGDVLASSLYVAMVGR